MHDEVTDRRLNHLMRAAAGCGVLVMMAAHLLTPRDAVEPVTALHLVTQAVGQIIPWMDVHDELLEQVRRDAKGHLDLALALLREPGIERWWTPVDRAHQVWI